MNIVDNVLKNIQTSKKEDLFVYRYEHHSRRQELAEFSWSLIFHLIDTFHILIFYS